MDTNEFLLGEEVAVLRDEDHIKGEVISFIGDSIEIKFKKKIDRWWWKDEIRTSTLLIERKYVMRVKLIDSHHLDQIQEAEDTKREIQQDIRIKKSQLDELERRAKFVDKQVKTLLSLNNNLELGAVIPEMLKEITDTHWVQVEYGRWSSTADRYEFKANERALRSEKSKEITIRSRDFVEGLQELNTEIRKQINQ